MVTNIVSNIGSKKISVGIPKTANTFEACGCLAIANVARVKPKNKLPLSPIKIEAGGKLKIRNPSTLPANAMDT